MEALKKNKELIIVLVATMSFFNALTLVELMDYKEQIIKEIKAK